ncbi:MULTISPECIES: glycine cleavage system protein R [Shewanella]|uniref:Glycine cleavage system transcriptional repressor n=3 Tax=Shewanella TaxID=22 RepID=A0A220UNN5_9GAMM|nr:MULTISPECIES: ACT domain-containing protein [Shewanella]QXN23480.1 glycine cleavage system transcriptional repressor [Shewanella putrefaciens]ABK47888.1 glycine cleavage system transcriptional repressor, putative [Shewanella sp. ANA-3]ASK69610.1 glycine cleavage system transcriptional repressor [Shewanella bicestrii]MCL1121306.1 glycine cleavage system transcriptional repressor [Shewanella seohaensis]MDH1470022.1 glycine cleavage system transcriptional repressor [Shewanella sp. GD03713]
MTNFLVVTAMGVDRPGLVSKLARLASDCDCDIVDSRMALFGNEFTLIMMLSGSWASITKIESLLPSLSVELELMTVMKRTSKHTPQNYLSRLEVRFTGKDQRGTMKLITQFLADRSLDLAAVRSFSEELDNGEQTQTISLTINIPEKVELEKLEKSIYQLSEEMALDCTIRRMEGTTSRSDRG